MDPQPEPYTTSRQGESSGAVCPCWQTLDSIKMRSRSMKSGPSWIDFLRRASEASAFMSIGTKSVLFGAHCFFLHPLFVALAWARLYGVPREWRLYLPFSCTTLDTRAKRIWTARKVRSTSISAQRYAPAVRPRMGRVHALPLSLFRKENCPPLFPVVCGG